HYRYLISAYQIQAHHTHNALCIDVLLSHLNVYLAGILACFLNQQCDRSSVKAFVRFYYNRCLNHNNPPCSRLTLSANSLSFRSLWLIPDFPTGGISIAPSSFRVASGFSRRAVAASTSPSGMFSKPIVSLRYVISSTCFTAADTVLLILAVSQFT